MTNTFHKASQEKQLLQDTSCQKLTKIDNEPKKATPLLRSLAQMVKNLSVIWETWVPSLGWEDPWRKAWQPTPVFLPGESHGQRSLAGYSPWGLKDMTEVTKNTHVLIPDIHCAIFTFMHWRRKWQPTPVFLPGESQGQGSLVGCRLWGHTESDTAE